MIQNQLHKHKGIGKANGKIILMGEHSVVYHHPAIAWTFSEVEVVATVSSSASQWYLESELFHGPLMECPEMLHNVKSAIYNSLLWIDAARTASKPSPSSYWQEERFFSKDWAPLHVHIHSTIPHERGMGSSAAVCTSIVRALFNYYHVELSQNLLWEIVQEAEKIAHGNPSGIDTIATSSNALVYYTKSSGAQVLSPNLEAWLVVCDSGQTGQTKAAVLGLKNRLTKEKKAHQSLAMEMINQLGLLTHEAKACLLRQDASTLGRFMNAAHHLLQQLNISNATLDHLVQTALDNGALGAKLTGGGRGGCIIALSDQKQTADQIMQALMNQGAKTTWLAKIGGNV